MRFFFPPFKKKKKKGAQGRRRRIQMSWHQHALSIRFPSHPDPTPPLPVYLVIVQFEISIFYQVLYYKCPLLGLPCTWCNTWCSHDAHSYLFWNFLHPPPCHSYLIASRLSFSPFCLLFFLTAEFLTLWHTFFKHQAANKKKVLSYDLPNVFKTLYVKKKKKKICRPPQETRIMWILMTQWRKLPISYVDDFDG